MMARVVLGLLGWSNKRNGVEFYKWDDKLIRRHSSEWGELLAYEKEIKDQEGSAVICLVLPREARPDEVRSFVEDLLKKLEK